MANRFKVTFVGQNEAQAATRAVLQVRKRRKNNPDEDPVQEGRDYSMTKISDAPATFEYSANLGGPGSAYKRLVRVIAYKGSVKVATVDGPSPDRL